jgi:hypothetical protein
MYIVEIKGYEKNLKMGDMSNEVANTLYTCKKIYKICILNEQTGWKRSKVR